MAGSLSKTGTGTLTLTGNSTYSGGTTITSGTLVAGSNTALGSGDVYVDVGGILKIAAGTSIANKISLGSQGQVVSAGDSTITLSAGSSLAGWQTNSTLSSTTTAAILSGSAATDMTIAATWSAPISTPSTSVYSDVLTLTNTGTTGSFVLQMSYDQAAINAAGVDETLLALGWLDGTAWVNAVNGNSNGTAAGFLGAYDAGNLAMNQLGAYGVDTANNVVWAVLDHNSDFGVVPVPEPATVVMIVGGVLVLGLGWYRRRKRNAARKMPQPASTVKTVSTTQRDCSMDDSYHHVPKLRRQLRASTGAAPRRADD